MKTIGSSAVLLVGNFILHFIGLGLSQSFGIIYSELLTFFDSGKSETSWIASLNFGLFLGCGKFVQIYCLFFVLQYFLSSVSVLHRSVLGFYNPFNTRKKSDILAIKNKNNLYLVYVYVRFVYNLNFMNKGSNDPPCYFINGLYIYLLTCSIPFFLYYCVGARATNKKRSNVK